jgi:hypothetical protein
MWVAATTSTPSTAPVSSTPNCRLLGSARAGSLSGRSAAHLAAPPRH